MSERQGHGDGLGIGGPASFPDSMKKVPAEQQTRLLIAVVYFTFASFVYYVVVSEASIWGVRTLRLLAIPAPDALLLSCGTALFSWLLVVRSKLRGRGGPCVRRDVVLAAAACVPALVWSYCQMLWIG